MLKYSTCLADFEESLEKLYDENTTQNDQFRRKRILKFYKYLFSIKRRKHPIIPVIADTRIEDDLIALKIDGKKTLGNVSDSPILSVRITRFSSLQPRYYLAVIQDF